ncbi:hypothetical protein CerSpe_016400 [Prunus speciosa]
MANTEGYFVEGESVEEKRNDSSLRDFDTSTQEIVEINGHLEYDGLNFHDMSIDDLKGREFANFEEAEKFYSEYALAIGFSIRRNRLGRGEGGLVRSRQWVCSKEGKRAKKWTNRENL